MRPRLWPALAIVLAALLWLAKTWLTGDAIRQERVLHTFISCGLALIALTVWLGLFSRLPPRARLGAAGAVVATLALAGALFRVRGVSGDLMPILEPRWSERSAERSVLPATAPALASPRAPVAPSALPHVPGAAVDARPGVPEAALPGREPEPRRAAASATQDFPQFLGPNRDGTLQLPRLARDWTARPPRLLWRVSVGEAWSGFAVAGGIAVTQEQQGDDERVVAYDLASGRPLWSHADEARYSTVIAGTGPRATPTLHAGRVFTMGATGILNALDLATGRRLWSRDVVGETSASSPDWGRSGSPLVVEGRVVVSAGGSGGRSLVAYDAATGEAVWSAGSDGSSYSSPVLLSLAGRRQIVILNQSSLAGHDPASGALLWEHAFPGQQPNVAAPVTLGEDRLLVSVGYGIGSKAYRLAPAGDGLEASVAWESPRLKSKFANLIVHDGRVYGLDDGVLTCLDPATGERLWKAGRYGHGQLLLVAGLLLVQTEAGEIVLVEPRPDAHVELARHAVLDGKTWNPPALAGRVLLVRSDREAAAYELPVE